LRKEAQTFAPFAIAVDAMLEPRFITLAGLDPAKVNLGWGYVP
jgi:hypothetical protein